MSEAPTPTQGEPAHDESLGEAGIKALQAEREARKQAEKSAHDLQSQLDALNAAKLTDLEKAQQAAKVAEDAASAARVEALRYKVAAVHGISADDAELLLTAGTEEAMTAQAERIAAREPDTRTPKPDLSQGGNGKPAPASTGDIFANFIESKLN